MNVQVLGDDIMYGASANTIFRKQRSNALRIMAARRGMRFGDDEMMGVDWGAFGKGISKLGSGIVKTVKTPGGKALVGAALTGIAGRLSPTQKAQLASAQEIAGISPQVISTGGMTTVTLPEDGFKKNLPYIIGGVALIGLFAVVALKKRA